MKEVKNIILLQIAFTLLLYLTHSFFFTSFNFVEWTEDGRFSLVLWFWVLLIVSLSLVLIPKIE